MNESRCRGERSRRRASSCQAAEALLVVVVVPEEGNVVHVVQTLAVEAADDVHEVFEDDGSVEGARLR